MKTIHLYGTAKDKLGQTIRLEVESAAEAIRAIVTTRPGGEVLREGHYVLVRRTLDKKSGRFALSELRGAIEDVAYQLDLDALTLGLGAADLHIIPVVGGAGGRGLGKILLGVAMVAGAWITAGASLGAGTAAFGHAMAANAISFLGMHVSYATIAIMGVMTTLGGISMALAKPPAAPDSQDTNDSYIFTGPTNVGAQNNPVPVVHGGPIRVGSVTVSSAISTANYGSSSLLSNGIYGGVITALLDNAGY